MNQSLELAKSYTNLWWEHDKKNYDGVQKKAKQLMVLLNQKKADEISKEIEQAYELSDKAEKKPELYKTVKKKLINARIIANQNPIVGEYHWKWWIAFRQQNYPAATYYIFRKHLIMSKNILNAIKMTYYLVKSGLAHNHRNHEECISWLKKYWETYINGKQLNNLIITF